MDAHYNQDTWTDRIRAALKRRIDALLYDLRTPRTLIERPFGRMLMRRYNGDEGQNTDDRTGSSGYALIHYALLRNEKPKRVLCVGSRKGFVPGALALALRDNHRGHVDFVDSSYSKESHYGKSWGGIGFWNRVSAKKHFAHIGVDKWITFYRMTTVEFAARKPSYTYQYIYIDGDHSYEGVQTDYRLFWPRLEKGGYLVLHDVCARGSLEGGKFGVRKFWREIGDKGITIKIPSHSGLGILQKK